MERKIVTTHGMTANKETDFLLAFLVSQRTGLLLRAFLSINSRALSSVISQAA